MYQCESCTVAAALDGLDEANTEAWAMFQQVCSRFASQTRSSGSILDRLTVGLDGEAYTDLVTRLGIIYDAYFPPKANDAS